MLDSALITNKCLDSHLREGFIVFCVSLIWKRILITSIGTSFLICLGDVVFG